MIQRIQTLYLLLAAGLVACAAFLPLASFASGGEEFRLYAFGLRTADGETVQSSCSSAVCCNSGSAWWR